MSICLTLTDINWPLTRDVVAIIGTFGALAIGALGLSTWNRQLRGASEYDTAKRAILLTYKVQQEIQNVRSPMMFLNKDEVEAGRRLEEEQRIYDERMRALYEKWTDLQAVRLEAKVIWGDRASDCFDQLQKVIGNLKSAIWMHFWLKGAYAGPGAEVDTTPARRIENNRIVYYESETDEFSIKVTSAVENVEKFFKRKTKIGKET